MKTVSELIKLSSEFLNTKEIENSRKAAEELISDVLGVGRLDLYLSYDRPLEAQEIDEIRKRLSRRAKGEPWQYIAGQIEFYHTKIKVSPSVLIPRQETEILVDIIARELSHQDLEAKSLLDLCTGSGCIGLALKKAFPKLHVVLADFSENALNLASENAKENELTVEIVQGDFLTPLKDKFDFIVCNPPYISEKSYEGLHFSVKDFEPKLALVAKEEGLEFYKKFAEEGRNYLKSSGKVWFEIGFDQGESLFKLFDTPLWKNQKIEKDWSQHDRFFSLENE